MSSNNFKEIFNGIEEDWRSNVLREHIQEFKDILNPLDINKITPQPKNILRAFKETNYENVKIVIIGQDPYPKEGVADGLAFSCNKIQGSLINIFKAQVKSGCISEKPETGDLTHWAKQGVLLLNTKLTTNVGESNAHPQWESFTRKVVSSLSSSKEKEGKKLLFLLWGKDAQKYNVSEFHKTLYYGHPSPLNSTSDFSECSHFTEAIEFCKEEYDFKLNWEARKNLKISIHPVSTGKDELKMSIFNETAKIAYYKMIETETSPQLNEWNNLNMCLNYILKKEYENKDIEIILSNKNIIIDLTENIERWYSIKRKMYDPIIEECWDKIQLLEKSKQIKFNFKWMEINTELTERIYENQLAEKEIGKVYYIKF